MRRKYGSVALPPGVASRKFCPVGQFHKSSSTVPPGVGQLPGHPFRPRPVSAGMTDKEIRTSPAHATQYPARHPDGRGKPLGAGRGVDRHSGKSQCHVCSRSRAASVQVKSVLRLSVLLMTCRSRVRAPPAHLRLYDISGAAWTAVWTEAPRRTAARRPRPSEPSRQDQRPGASSLWQGLP